MLSDQWPPAQSLAIASHTHKPYALCRGALMSSICPHFLRLRHLLPLPPARPTAAHEPCPSRLSPSSQRTPLTRLASLPVGDLRPETPSHSNPLPRQNGRTAPCLQPDGSKHHLHVSPPLCRPLVRLCQHLWSIQSRSRRSWQSHLAHSASPAQRVPPVAPLHPATPPVTALAAILL